MMPSPALLLPVFLTIAAMTRPAVADVTIEQRADKAIVKIDGKLFTEYLVRSGAKPILWPLLGPTGKPMTRNFPMQTVAGEHRDHVHQRSMWFTHGNVNGFDFWTEQEAHGTIQQRRFVKVRSGRTGLIVTRNDWLSAAGKKQCEDQRVLEFGGDAAVRWIDFAITLRATEGPVTFGDTKEGAFGLRLAEWLTVDAHRGGRIVNSEGQSDEAAWGKPAAWVDYHAALDGDILGVAILNHPSSFRFPTPWHVRGYGLLAANPFGKRAFGGKQKDNGAYTLPAGQSLLLRYRVLFHRGDEKAAKIAAAFADYARWPLPQ